MYYTYFYTKIILLLDTNQKRKKPWIFEEQRVQEV